MTESKIVSELASAFRKIDLSDGLRIGSKTLRTALIKAGYPDLIYYISPALVHRACIVYNDKNQTGFELSFEYDTVHCSFSIGVTQKFAPEIKHIKLEPEYEINKESVNKKQKRSVKPESDVRVGSCPFCRKPVSKGWFFSHIKSDIEKYQTHFVNVSDIQILCTVCKNNLSYGISDEGLMWHVTKQCTSKEYKEWCKEVHTDLSLPR